MKPWRVVLLLLFAIVSTSAAAPILIYRGTGKQVGKNDAVSAGPVNVFLVIDPATEQAAVVTFYTRKKEKRKFIIQPSAYRRIDFLLDTGKTSMVYNRTEVLTPNSDYLLSTRTLRGTATGLKISSQAIQPFLHPKTITGVEVVFADQEDAKSSDLRFTVTYQQSRSVAANNANKTIATVVADLTAELVAKGY